jgi:hypothetical protein
MARVTQTEGVQPGQRIRVMQTIRRRDGAWRMEVTGILISAEFKPTGSWYAHGKNDRLWLPRLVIQKDDGEITTISMDESTAIEVIDA